MQSSTKRPYFGSLFICDAAIKSDSGKVDCIGLFTNFRVWAFPSYVRNYYLVFTLFSFPKGKSKVLVNMRAGRKKPEQINEIELGVAKPGSGSVAFVPLSSRFSKEGKHSIELSLKGSNKIISTPFMVGKEPWPVFSRKDLRQLKTLPNVPRSIRSNITCSKCSGSYLFEATPLPDHEFAQGIRPFPESGKFDCEGCDHTLNIKDMEGNLLNTIKATLISAVEGE